MTCRVTCHCLAGGWIGVCKIHDTIDGMGCKAKCLDASAILIRIPQPKFPWLKPEICLSTPEARCVILKKPRASRSRGPIGRTHNVLRVTVSCSRGTRACSDICRYKVNDLLTTQSNWNSGIAQAIEGPAKDNVTVWRLSDRGDWCIEPGKGEVCPAGHANPSNCVGRTGGLERSSYIDGIGVLIAQDGRDGSKHSR